jgi:hypothetical protein
VRAARRCAIMMRLPRHPVGERAGHETSAGSPALPRDPFRTVNMPVLRGASARRPGASSPCLISVSRSLLIEFLQHPRKTADLRWPLSLARSAAGLDTSLTALSATAALSAARHIGPGGAGLVEKG